MRVLIVEDELLLAQRLERFCREILSDRLETLRVATQFSEAGALIHESPIDLLLLDLNLEGQDGLALLDAAAAGSFHTVVVSANTQWALRAFEYGVVDFVPKPFTRERLAQSLARVVNRDGAASCATKFLGIRKQGRVELVPIDRIVYAEGAGAYAEIVLDNGSRALHDKTLEQLHRLLPPIFERIHKSYIVRMNAIRMLRVEAGGRYVAELHDGTRLPLGRTHYREVRAKLG